VRAQEGIELLVVVGADDIKEGFEVVGERLQEAGCRCFRLRHLIELLQHPHAQRIIEAVALTTELAVAVDRLDATIHSALHEIVGNGGRRKDKGAAPGVSESLALGAGAQDIGALPAHARRARRRGDGAGSGEYVEERADPFGRPAIEALGAT
jgi:hypothetical protein